jgi:hypothetical protein
MRSPAYIAYRCGSCKEWCLNERSDPATRHRECRSCYRLPDLRRDLVDELHPELLWTVGLDLDFPAFSPAATSSRGTSVRERAESPSRSEQSEREYGVSCASERFLIEATEGDHA